MRRQTNVESEAITDEHHDYVQEIEDIDQFDARNPQLVSDYAKDTFEYLRQLEVSNINNSNIKYGEKVFV